MAIETDADRAVFVSANDFGVKVVWASSSGAHAPFDAIFDDTFIAIAAGEMDFSQEGGNLRIEMRSVDVPQDAAHGDTLVIGSSNYSVVEFRPDGTGMTVVRLMEA